MQYADLQLVCLDVQYAHYADKHDVAEKSEDVKNQVLMKPHERTYGHRFVRPYTKGINTVRPTLMKNKEAKCTCAFECD